jgi:hypothetical protein
METETKSKRKTRKRHVAPVVAEKLVEEKVDLKSKLREKMMLHKLGRTKQGILDKEIEKIEDTLASSKKLPGKEKKKLKERLKLLEEVEEKRSTSINDDPAVYVDNASYGGGFEHPE